MKKTVAYAILFILAFQALPVNAQSVVNSLHNLSVSGPGTVRATSETQVCIFCHTPHNSKPVSPLWNRDDPGLSYTLYQSSTIQAAPGQPDGSSILCLSCHDGTIALGHVLSRPTDIDFSGGITVMPAGSANLSKDLTDDHPVSFIYNSALASADGQLRDPSAILPPVRLEDQRMQCASCHDPHNNFNTRFLQVTNQFSDLCFRCHDRNYWGGSSHSTSSSTWNNAAPDPWPRTPYPTVAENACENCHAPHNAGGKPRLMNYLAEERNCLSCHNGNVANTNIEAQLTKAYLHNVYNYTAVHDASEDEVVLTRHVECEDCHNPHAVRSWPASAPAVNGFNEGVRGVNQDGNPVNPVRYQYEICYRCHAESPDKPSSHTVRQVEQSNVRLEFDLINPSFHPIEGPGRNLNVPSLIAPDYSESSVMYCTDCHASDGSGPAGPHGSVFPAILKYRYATADNTLESYSNYELCYRCHDRNSILNDESFAYHERHIVEETTPCNACHDPHGISHTQGNSTNHAHLINFDLNIVFPDNNGRFRYEDNGTFSGRCYLRCHGRNHPGWWY
jgi:predicted CXXCH cytochrome family protein